MTATSLIRKIAAPELLSSLSIMGMRVSMLAAKFILGLFIVRFIGLEAMGVYGLIGGASAIVQMVMRGGIFSNISRKAVNQPLEELTTNLRFYLTGALGLYLISAPFVFAAAFYFGVFNITALAFFVIIFEHLGMDIFVLANNLKRPALANVILSLQSTFWIYIYIVLGYVIVPMRSLEWIFTFWIGGGLIALFMAALLTQKWPWPQAFAKKIHLSWYIENTKASWRIYISEIVNTTSIYLDRYLITIFLSLELVGVYVLFWQVVNAICNLVGAGILQVYRPRLISAYLENDTLKFRSLFYESAVRTISSTIFLSIIFACVVPLLIGFTKQSIAIDHLPLLWLMLFALIFRMGGDICGYTLYAQHRDDYVLHSALLKLIASLVVGITSMTLVGIYGVVLTSISTGSIAMLYAWYVWRHRKE